MTLNQIRYLEYNIAFWACLIITIVSTGHIDTDDDIWIQVIDFAFAVFWTISTGVYYNFQHKLNKEIKNESYSR